jgi:hypothetical protein
MAGPGQATASREPQLPKRAHAPTLTACVRLMVHFVDEADPDLPVVVVLTDEPAASFVVRVTSVVQTPYGQASA